MVIIKGPPAPTNVSPPRASSQFGELRVLSYEYWATSIELRVLSYRIERQTREKKNSSLLAMTKRNSLRKVLNAQRLVVTRRDTGRRPEIMFQLRDNLSNKQCKVGLNRCINHKTQYLHTYG